MRRLRSALLGLFGVAAILLLSGLAGAFVPRPFFGVSVDAVPVARSRTILVVSNPIHTDIALPLDAETLAAFPFLEADGFPVHNPLARWVLIGWGGRSFYMETPHWSDLKPMPVLRSFTVDQSVLHVEFLGAINEHDPAIMPVSVTEEGYRAMLSAISASFQRNAGATEIIPDKSYDGADRFYEATGSFNAFAGCNTWTAAMLRTAGLRTGLWNPLPVSLNLSISRFNPTAVYH